jgi:hypothetical protein
VLPFFHHGSASTASRLAHGIDSTGRTFIGTILLQMIGLKNAPVRGAS